MADATANSNDSNELASHQPQRFLDRPQSDRDSVSVFVLDLVGDRRAIGDGRSLAVGVAVDGDASIW